MKDKSWYGLVALIAFEVMIAFLCHSRWPDANVPTIAAIVIPTSVVQFVIVRRGSRRP
jgi:hypothetical protein